MSYVIFSTVNRKVKLSSSERRWLACFCNEIFLKSLRLESFDYDYDANDHPLKEYLWTCTSKRLAELHIKIDMTELAGYKVSELCLNTAMQMGSLPVRLAAYIDNCCETHGFFLPEVHKKVIDVINTGLDIGCYRSEQGWDDVKGLFATEKEPIVMSYSVSDCFPNSYLTEKEQEGKPSKVWNKYYKELIKVQKPWTPEMLGFGDFTNGYQLVDRLAQQINQGKKL